MSKEAVARMSLARRGCRFVNRKKPPPFSDEHRSHISAANIGKRLTLESRAKISAKAKGRKPARSTRDAVSRANKRRYAEGTLHNANYYKAMATMRGEHHHSAKITDEQVAKVLRLYMAGMTQTKIAHETGVGVWTVQTIVAGRQWTHVPRPAGFEAYRASRNGSSSLRAADVVAIRQRYATSQDSMTVIAKDYGMSKCSVQHIVRRKTWTHLPDFQAGRRRYLESKGVLKCVA